MNSGKGVLTVGETSLFGSELTAAAGLQALHFSIYKKILLNPHPEVVRAGIYAAFGAPLSASSCCFAFTFFTRTLVFLGMKALSSVYSAVSGRKSGAQGSRHQAASTRNLLFPFSATPRSKSAQKQGTSVCAEQEAKHTPNFVEGTQISKETCSLDTCWKNRNLILLCNEKPRQKPKHKNSLNKFL